jgi:hypothetical protein
MRRITTLCSLLVLAGPVVAQDLPVEDQLLAEEPVIRRYTVELIVFSYTENVSVGTELFFPDEPAPLDDNALLNSDTIVDGEGPIADDSIANRPATRREEESIEDSDNDGDSANDGDLMLEDVDLELQFVLLPEEEHTLGDISHKFDLLDAYETILHVAWTQPTYPKEETLPIELHAFGEVPVGLDGSFTLYLSRYLHLVVDLALDAEKQNPDDAAVIEEFEDNNEAAFSFGDSRIQDDMYVDPFNDEFQQQIVRYHLQENRILKNGEVRYFDHPKFGVVAKVTRVEEAEEEPEEETLQESQQLLSNATQ